MGSFSQSDKRLVFSKQQLVSNQHNVIIKQGFYMILKMSSNECDNKWFFCPHLNSREGCHFRSSGYQDIFGLNNFSAAILLMNCHLENH